MGGGYYSIGHLNLNTIINFQCNNNLSTKLLVPAELGGAIGEFSGRKQT